MKVYCNESLVDIYRLCKHSDSRLSLISNVKTSDAVFPQMKR